MLLPRYSLRTTLLVTTVCAIFFVILGQAVQGRPWAVVVSVSVVSLLVLLLFHALLYLITSRFTRLFGGKQLPALTSQGGVQSTLDQPAAPKPDE